MSSVWDFAAKIKIGKELKGRCNRCNEIIQCSSRSTTSLKNHLKTHGILIDQATGQKRSLNDNDTEREYKKTRSVVDFLVQKNLKEIISDLATDGISIRAITRNSYIRNSIKKDGHRLPANESDVMQLLISDYEDKKLKMISDIKEKIGKNLKFSITLDEYTTIRGRRFLGINVHDSDEKITMKTGLVRILGSCPADEMLTKIKDHLSSFGISLDNDVVGSTQDGAAINKKFIRLASVVGQFCFNHGIHLAVCDSLYTKNEPDSDLIFFDDSIDESENDIFENGLDFEILEDSFEDSIDYHMLLKKSREVVKFIKNSTVRNHIFQTKVVSLFEHEIELHLDVKHRWNSIPTMINPLLKTKVALYDTFTELNKLDIINALDFEALEMLQKAMEPIKLAVEVLSKQDATLVTADTVLNFAFRKLENLQSEISSILLKNLKKRVEERWNNDLMNLLKSLKDPSFTPNKNAINYASNLATRLFGMVDENDIINIEQSEEALHMTLENELKLLLQKDSVPVVENSNKLKCLQQEFTLFKNTGTRTENLEKIYNALLSIKPTSTDVERVFSVCTSFCTKIRSRLSDKSLNALVFLKFYYNK